MTAAAMTDQGSEAPRAREFWKLWAGYTASQFGEQITLFCLPVLAATVLHATPGEMGWLNAAQSLPFLLFTLVAGAVIDRVRRRPLMIATDLLRAAVLVLIPVLALMGLLTVPLLCVVGFVVMSASVFFDVADQSYVPTLVGRSGLVGANSKLETSRSAGLILGPTIGGVLAQALGPALGIAVNVATYIASALFLGAITVRETAVPVPAARRSIVHEIGEGLKFVLAHPLIRPLALCALIWSIAWFDLMTVLVLYVTRTIGVSAAGFGLVLSSQGVGALLGAIVAPRIRRSGIGVGWSILVGPVICSFGTPLILSAVLLPAGSVLALPLMMAGQFLLGLGPTIWVVNNLSLRQAITPSALRGRTNATVRFMTFGARPIGAALGGFVGDFFGLTAGVGVAAVLFVACLLPVVLSAVPVLKTEPDAAD